MSELDVSDVASPKIVTEAHGANLSNTTGHLGILMTYSARRCILPLHHISNDWTLRATPGCAHGKIAAKTTAGHIIIHHSEMKYSENHNVLVGCCSVIF